jgi:hypothetical protein
MQLLRQSVEDLCDVTAGHTPLTLQVRSPSQRTLMPLTPSPIPLQSSSIYLQSIFNLPSIPFNAH